MLFCLGTAVLIVAYVASGTDVALETTQSISATRSRQEGTQSTVVRRQRRSQETSYVAIGSDGGVEIAKAFDTDIGSSIASEIFHVAVGSDGKLDIGKASDTEFDSSTASEVAEAALNRQEGRVSGTSEVGDVFRQAGDSQTGEIHHDDQEGDHNGEDSPSKMEQQLQAKLMTRVEGKGSKSLDIKSMDGSLSEKCEDLKDKPAPVYPAKTANGRMIVGCSDVTVQSNDGNRPVIVFYHGIQASCWQCGGLRDYMIAAGYTVISPCDHSMGFAAAILKGVGTWGWKTFENIDKWVNPRKLGVVGYSMGGGAVIKVSYDYPTVPVVAMFPGVMLAGLGSPIAPILYMTGDKECWICTMGATAAYEVWNKYWWTGSKKAYLKYTNADHGFPCGAGTHKVNAATLKWFNCYIKNEGCGSFKKTVCTDAKANGDVEYCEVKM